MLEAQINTPLGMNDLEIDEPIKNIKVNERKSSELKVPFIYFFEMAVRSGLFKKLGELEKLKEKCIGYGGYIDRWLAKSIKNKDIKILKDGEIVPNNYENLDNFSVEKDNQSLQALENISTAVTKIAVKNIANGNLKKTSACRTFALKNHPEVLLEYHIIYKKFMQDLLSLTDRSVRLGNTNGKVHYVSVSACAVDKEVLSEI